MLLSSAKLIWCICYALKYKHKSVCPIIREDVVLFVIFEKKYKQKEEKHKSPSVIDCEWMTDVGWIESVEVQIMRWDQKHN